MIWAHLFCCKNNLHTLFCRKKDLHTIFLSRKRFTHFVRKVFARWKLPSGKFRLFGPLGPILFSSQFFPTPYINKKIDNFIFPSADLQNDFSREKPNHFQSLSQTPERSPLQHLNQSIPVVKRLPLSPPPFTFPIGNHKFTFLAPKVLLEDR